MKSQYLLFTIILSAGVNALAADSVPIRLGDTELEPQLRVLYFQNGNIYSDDEVETEDNGYHFNPYVKWEADRGLNRFYLVYSGEVVRHVEEDVADYSDHNFSLNSDLEFDKRSRLSLVARYAAEHEDPGTGRSRDLDTEVDGITEYDDTGVTATYAYGARTAKGGLEFALEYAKRDYSTNPEVTDGYSFSRISPAFTFLYAVSSATRIVSGIEYSVLDYEKADGITESDNSNYFLFAGARWEITGKTGGSVRLGYGAADYDSRFKNDQSSMLLRTDAFWKPLRHAEIKLNVRRSFSVDTDSPSVTSVIDVSWGHDWSSRFKSYVNYSFRDVDADNSNDDSTTSNLSLELVLGVRRWIDFNLIASGSSTTSPVDEYEYDKQWMGAGFTLRM